MEMEKIDIFENDGYQYRKIPTGFYTEKVFQILSACAMRLQRNIERAKNTAKMKGLKRMRIMQDIDNQIVINIKKSTWGTYGFDGINDADVLKTIAWAFKDMLLNCSYITKDHWSRDSKDVTMVEGIAIPVKEFYYIYDTFLGRRAATRSRAYDDKLKNDLHGVALDPIMTEMILAQKDEVKQIHEAAEREQQRLNSEYNSEYNEVLTALREKYDALKKRARADADKKIAEIKAQLNEIIAAQAAA